MQRRTAIAALAAGTLSPFATGAQTAPRPADAAGLPARLVQDFHDVFGEHHARAVHAKGVILQGGFAPLAEARTLCAAELFTQPAPVTVRFSNLTGLPDIPDASGSASPRGFAVKVRPPAGAGLDIVSHSFDGFPAATAEEFGALLQALAHSPAGTASPTPFEAFLAAHPAAKTFFTTQKPPPASFATTAYFGVNAFLFTDPAGRARPVRYRFVPEAGEQYLDEAALRGRSPGYLMEEIVGRVAAGPIRFTWLAQLAEPGDRPDDPSVAWPEARTQVKLGVITIDRAGPGTPEADRALLFLPGVLPPGIGIADPMVAVRTAAYPLSFHERQ